MSDYGMTPAQVMALADDMDQQNSTMSNSITQMIGDLDKAVNDWDGPSKEFYAAARQRWLQQMQTMSGDLGQAAATVRNIVENVMNNEKNVSGMWQ